eukprot:6174881-Pleurochrysis_carterae.AAC.4
MHAAEAKYEMLEAAGRQASKKRKESGKATLARSEEREKKSWFRLGDEAVWVVQVNACRRGSFSMQAQRRLPRQQHDTAHYQGTRHFLSRGVASPARTP